MTSVHELRAIDVERLAARAGGWLRRSGLSTGDRVAVVATNDPRLLALAHGALRIGVVPVFVNPHLHEPERRWILEDSQPSLVVDDLDQVDWQAPPADIADVPLGHPMLYTSGTTGRPKGVWRGVLSEEHARGWVEDEQDLWAPDPDATFLVCSPLYHSAGYRSATCALLAGARVLLLDRFDAATVARLMTEEAITGTFLVPTHLRRIFALGNPQPARAPHRILHAGEPCPEPLKRRTIEWLGETIWEFYGSTEGQFAAISTREWLEHPGSVGRARRGRTLEIVDPEHEGIGTVYVTAPEFARWEYWGDAERTKQAWRGDRFTVGDLGRLDEDGYLFLHARREDLIISGGVNVYPAEVERVVLEHPAVHEAAGFGVPDPEWGERVCVAVVADLSSESPVTEWLHERLDGAHRPKDVVLVESLPRTTTGKIDRQRLRDLVD
jgi:acyl-CoA synthetase (AMP-forming)/AMP-acid ligase II